MDDLTDDEIDHALATTLDEFARTTRGMPDWRDVRTDIAENSRLRRMFARAAIAADRARGGEAVGYVKTTALEVVAQGGQAWIRGKSGVHDHETPLFTRPSPAPTQAQDAEQAAIPESAILHRMKYHHRPANEDGPEDWDLYPPDVDCKDCVDVLIVRASALSTSPAPAPAAPPTNEWREAVLDCPRNELVTAIQTIASDYENALGMFGDDGEGRRKAKGDIAHALKVAAKYNQNGPGCTPPATPAWEPAIPSPQPAPEPTALSAWMKDFLGKGNGLVRTLYNEPDINKTDVGAWMQLAMQMLQTVYSCAATQPVGREATPREVDLLNRIRAECDHAGVNSKRLPPSFGKAMGEPAVPEACIEAAIGGWARAHSIDAVAKR
jgi:hypothetical protein